MKLRKKSSNKLLDFIKEGEKLCDNGGHGLVAVAEKRLEHQINARFSSHNLSKD